MEYLFSDVKQVRHGRWQRGVGKAVLVVTGVITCWLLHVMHVRLHIPLGTSTFLLQNGPLDNCSSRIRCITPRRQRR